MKTYEEYLSFQLSGRLRPGCGHVGQKMAMDPSWDFTCSDACPSPLFILIFRSLHWRDALSNCLYRFCKSGSISYTDIEGGYLYWHIVREHIACHALQLWIILLCGCLALQVISKEIIQHSNGKQGFNLLECGRKKPSFQELLIPAPTIGASTKEHLHFKDTLTVNNCHIGISRLPSACAVHIACTWIQWNV